MNKYKYLILLFLLASYGNENKTKPGLKKNKPLSNKAITDEQKQLNDQLLNASHNGNFATLKELLEKGANVDAQDNEDWTALHWATFWNYLNIVQVLLKNKADVNIQNNFGTTALMDASVKGYLEIVQILVDNEANVHAKDHKGWTAFNYASTSQSPNKQAIIKLLEEKGA